MWAVPFTREREATDTHSYGTLDNTLEQLPQCDTFSYEQLKCGSLETPSRLGPKACCCRAMRLWAAGTLQHT